MGEGSSDAHGIFVDFKKFLIFINQMIEGTFFKSAFIHKFFGSDFAIIPGGIQAFPVIGEAYFFALQESSNFETARYEKSPQFSGHDK